MIYETFCKKLKELRIEQGISQQTLAAKLNTTQRKISKLERGDVAPSLEFLVAFAKYFNVSTDYLLGLED